MPTQKIPLKPGNIFKFYSENEIPLFAVRQNQKRPKFKGWQTSAKVPSPSDSRFYSLISNGSNIGAALPEGILVLDFDKKNGGIHSLKKLNELLGYELISAGPTVCSPNSGFHVYCCIRGLKEGLRGKLDGSDYPGVDIRKQGNFVVIPPSKIDRRSYSWHPSSLDENGEVSTSLLTLPPELLPLVTKTGSVRAKSKVANRSSTQNPNPAKTTAGEMKGAISEKDVKTILDRLDVKQFRSREDWRKLMLSLHSASGGDAVAGAHFVDWSATDPDYADARYMTQHQSEWEGADVDGGIGPATLIHYINQIATDPEDPELVTVINKISSMLGSAEFTDFSDESTPDSSSLSWMNDQYEWTENVLAEKFIDQYGATIRYVPRWRKWMSYEGDRWIEAEESVFVGQAVREYVKSLWDFMKEVSQTWDPPRVKSVMTFIKNANSARGIANITSLSRCDSRVLSKISAWNADNDLLNVENGTIVLSTGEFRQHAATDLLTQKANVRFDKDAEAPKWLKALELIFEDNEELIRYMKQVLGYSLSGSCGEAILPICYGPSGENGKSTIWNVIHSILGDYAYAANESLLLGNQSKHETEVASLFGKRFVALSEPSDGATLKTSRLKELTGERTVTARRMREDFWEFPRTFTFFMATNYLPAIPSGDEAVFRRVRVIPFNVKISKVVKPDPNFVTDLIENEGSGILNWCLEGLMDYQSNGFVEPECVNLATRSYQHDSDDFSRFMSEKVFIGNGALGLQEGFDCYSSFCDSFPSLSKPQFSARLSREFKKKVARSGSLKDKTVFEGLRLKINESKVTRKRAIGEVENSGPGTTSA